MWPRIGPLPTFGVLYSISILSCFLIACLIARRLRLRHRVWLVVGICYMVGMTVICTLAILLCRSLPVWLRRVFQFSCFPSGAVLFAMTYWTK